MECSRLAGALDRAGAGTRCIGQKRVFPGMRHPKLSQVPALQTWVAERLFGVLPACRSFGSRRSGKSQHRPETRVPGHASPKAIPSASTPNLGGGAAIWSAPGLPELWIASERERLASEAFPPAARSSARFFCPVLETPNTYCILVFLCILLARSAIVCHSLGMASLPRLARAHRLSLTALGSLLALTSCDKTGRVGESSTDTDPFAEASAASAAGATASTASTAGTISVAEGGSPNYRRVLEQLQPGGDVLIFLDVEQEVRGLGTQMDGMLRTITEGPSPFPPQIRDLAMGGGSAQLLSDLGLGGLKSIGMSSTRRGTGYHNRSFLHVPSGPTGIFDTLGGKAEPFNIVTLAPADADIVVEADLNLQALIDHVQITSRTLGFPDMADAIDGWLDSPMHEALGDTPWRKLYDHLDTEIGLVAKMDSSKSMGPFSKGSPALPGMDLLLTLENMSWLADELLGMFPDDQLERASGDGFESATFAGEIPVGDGVTYKPVVHKDTINNRVLIAASPEHLAACLAAAGSVLASPEFAEATRDLPTEGNSLLFLSQAANKLFIGMVEQATEAAEEGPENEMMKTMMGMSFPDAPVATGHVTSVLTDGIHTASNAPNSHKSGAFLGNPTGIAIIASVAVPVYNSIIGRAEATSSQSSGAGSSASLAADAHPVATACRAYAAANEGRYPSQLNELVTGGQLTDASQLKWTHPRTGLPIDWVYTSVGSSPRGDQLLLRAPRIVDDKYFIVLVDGTQLNVTAEELAMISVR